MLVEPQLEQKYRIFFMDLPVGETFSEDQLPQL